MNLTIPEAEQLVDALTKSVKHEIFNKTDVLVCPPFTFLHALGSYIKNNSSGVYLGAQNFHWEAKGAFTGEVSAAMIKETGCRHVLIGHSERRHVMGETDAVVGKKLKCAIQEDLIPILCVGELLEERNKGITQDVIKRQLTSAIAGISSDALTNLIIAYEPVWAIGTGVNATPEQAQEVHKFIRNLYSQTSGRDGAELTRILYGGSVTADNTSLLISQGDIDGLLVGGASLKFDSFFRIIAQTFEKYFSKTGVVC